MAFQTNRVVEGFPADVLVELRPADRGRGVREQLEQGLRTAIQSDRLRPGTPMPATRVLAAELGVSRSVVVEAYGNLAADGYLDARQGSGTRVRLRTSRTVQAPPSPRTDPDRGFFERPYTAAPAGTAPLRLLGGLPDPALFPRERWVRHYRAALAELPDAGLAYPGSLGAPALREQLAAYLGRVRGVFTVPERMLVCTGFTQGVSLVCRALGRAGATRVAVEDPCFAMHRTAIAMTGVEPVPVPVDEGGIDLAALAREPDIAAVVVAPAHSYPAGTTLDAGRRRELLAWARNHDALLIEDDYDAEFRYDRTPIGALQGLAPERVAYIGGASKTFTPALRLGWIALPPDLAGAVEREKRFHDMGSPLLEQLAFARFLASGDFARHLRRVRPIYRARRDATLDAVSQYLPDVEWQGEAAGLHLHVLLPADVDAHALAQAALARGLMVENGAWHWADPATAPPSLVLGYSAAPEAAIRRGVAVLGQALEAVRGA
ncbi:MAG TPA: PLP-dependent aminotransferase family protein [Thermoleophilaceae bacterium]|nr:PLP-dependent aminotransferase family protein [Thermoleophilaceae bacterium]